MEKILISTRLDTQTHGFLQRIAERKDRKVAYLVRKAVEEYVERESKQKRRT